MAAPIKVIPRRFILDLDESEACDLVLKLKKNNEISSTSYQLARELQTKLGYEPRKGS